MTEAMCDSQIRILSKPSPRPAQKHLLFPHNLINAEKLRRAKLCLTWSSPEFKHTTVSIESSTNLRK